MNKEEILLKGESGNFLQIVFEEIHGFPESTSWQGGYEIRATLIIKSEAFQVRSNFFTTTYELFTFYQELLICNQSLAGKANYSSFEQDLTFYVEYDNMGHTLINGRFAASMPYDNALCFEFASDQSFIQATLQQLNFIATKYGGATGLK